MINFTKERRQIIVYFIIGIITNVLNYIAYLLVLISFSSPYIAGVFGFSTGLVSNFFLNKKYTFKSTVKFRNQILPYLAVQLFVLAVQLISLRLFILLMIDSKIAQIPAIIFSGLSNYFLLKSFIFKK